MALRSALDEPRWSATRGGVSTFVDSTAALRLGARATDLQVALAVGDRERAGRVAAEMVELLDSVNLSDAVRAKYGDLRKRITNGDSIGPIVGAAAAADDICAISSIRVGMAWGNGLPRVSWLRATHSADFFKSSETARFIEAAIRSGGFAPDEVEALRQVESVAKRGIAENEFETVRETFAKLIRQSRGLSCGSTCAREDASHAAERDSYVDDEDRPIAGGASFGRGDRRSCRPRGRAIRPCLTIRSSWESSGALRQPALFSPRAEYDRLHRRLEPIRRMTCRGV